MGKLDYKRLSLGGYGGLRLERDSLALCLWDLRSESPLAVAAHMMVLAGSLALAERAVEPLRGCVRRSLFNTIF